MPEQLFEPLALKAIIFDLDGTLYRQDALRKAMLFRLLRAYASRPLSGLRTIRVLSAYRKAQEHLRKSSKTAPPATDLAEAQIRLTCERTKMDPGVVAECVSRWMDQEPLDLVGHFMQHGLVAFLQGCQARGLRLGVLSDYPAEAKLNALGLDGFFDVVLTTQSPEIGVFKPNPRGLLLVAELFGVSPAECAYVGDRAEVDGVAAAAAGMACFIVTRKNGLRSTAPWTEVNGYAQLAQLLLVHGDSQIRFAVPQPRLNVG